MVVLYGLVHPSSAYGWASLSRFSCFKTTCLDFDECFESKTINVQTVFGTFGSTYAHLYLRTYRTYRTICTCCRIHTVHTVHTVRSVHNVHTVHTVHAIHAVPYRPFSFYDVFSCAETSNISGHMAVCGGWGGGDKFGRRRIKKPHTSDPHLTKPLL